MFGADWEREVFGMALSLSKSGAFEWEDFRQNLISSIAEWETTPCEGQPNWDYYECFFVALVRTIKAAGVLSPDEIDGLNLPLSTSAR